MRKEVQSKVIARRKRVEEVEILVPVSLSDYLESIALIFVGIVVSLSILISTGKLNPSEISINLGSKLESEKSAGTGSISGRVDTFNEYNKTICKEGGKPAVFMFSATWCPHCKWIGNTFNEWAKAQTELAVYRYEVDTNDNSLTEEKETSIPAEHMAIYREFNPSGSIPTFVFGCKYARIGNGYEKDDRLDKEVEAFDKIKDLLL